MAAWCSGNAPDRFDLKTNTLQKGQAPFSRKYERAAKRLLSLFDLKPNAARLGDRHFQQRLVNFSGIDGLVVNYHHLDQFACS